MTANAHRSGAQLTLEIDAAIMTESEKKVDLTEAEPGDILTYEIVLRNTGIADAYTISVSDTAPALTAYQLGSVTVDGVPSWAYTITEPGGAGIEYRGLVPLACRPRHVQVQLVP